MTRSVLAAVVALGPAASAAAALPSLPLSAAALVLGASWSTTADQQAAAELGVGAAGAGDVNGDGYDDVIVGASGFDTPSSSAAGKAYVFLGSAAGLAAAPAWNTVGDDGTWALLGTSLTAGDFDGDGYSDVVVGAPGASLFDGKVFVYRGSVSGPATAASWTATGGVYELLGYSLASGDVNRDGYADLVVGVPGLGGSSPGETRVYLGSAAGLAASPAWTARGDDQPGAALGACVVAGDLDGDGYADLVVSAPNETTTTAGAGKVFVYFGGAGGLASSPGWTFQGDTAATIGADQGLAIGDVNGDGYADLAVGGSGYDVGAATDAGRVWVFFGSPSGLASTAAWSTSGAAQAGAALGSAVAVADLDGDGYAEVIVGSKREDAAGADVGIVRVFRGSPAGPLDPPAPISVENGQAGAELGATVVAAGDVDGDGAADLLVAAPLEDVGGAIDAGQVWVVGGRDIAACDDGDPCSSDVYVVGSGCLHRPAGCATGPCGADATCSWGDLAVALGRHSPGGDVEVSAGSAAVVAQLELSTGGVGGTLTGLRVALEDFSGSGLARLVAFEDADDDGAIDPGSAPLAAGPAARMSGGSLAVDGIGLVLPPGSRRHLLLALESVRAGAVAATVQAPSIPSAAGALAAALLVAFGIAGAVRGWRPRSVRGAAAGCVLAAALGAAVLTSSCGRTLLAGMATGRVAIVSAPDVAVESAASERLVVHGPPLAGARFRVMLP